MYANSHDSTVLDRELEKEKNREPSAPHPLPAVRLVAPKKKTNRSALAGSKSGTTLIKAVFRMRNWGWVVGDQTSRKVT